MKGDSETASAGNCVTILGKGSLQGAEVKGTDLSYLTFAMLGYAPSVPLSSGLCYEWMLDFVLCLLNSY